MKITRNIIIDLLPLYLSDEVSDETRDAVESFLATDPSLAKLAEQARQYQPLAEAPVTLNKENELKILEKAKRLTKQRNLFMSMSFLFTGLLLTFHSDGNGVSWFWNGASAALPIFVLALASWIMFIYSSRKLSIENIEERNVLKNAFLGLGIMCSIIFVLLFAFASLEPLHSDILYFLAFFAAVGWGGFAYSLRQLSK